MLQRLLQWFRLAETGGKLIDILDDRRANFIPDDTHRTGRRKREVGDGYEDVSLRRQIFLEEIAQIGYDKLGDPDCQKWLFCQMATFGGYNENANGVQKTLYKVALLYVQDKIRFQI